MKRSKVLVSVVMCVFNTEKYVKRAIESILHQTLQNFEFIIVNDASKDLTSTIVQLYAKRDKRIRLINNDRNLKIAHSLNRGVSYAKADLIARMDADDISLPERLETQYAFLKQHPNIAIVGTNISVTDDKEKEVWKREYPTESKEIKKIIFRYAPFAHPTVMFRKKVFEELGGYDPKMIPCEDIDFWFRIGTKYNFGNIPKSLLKYSLSVKSGSHYDIRKTELVGFKIKIKAISKYGYRPNLYDIVYNVLQFLSLWVTPANTRIKLYNALRSRKLI